MPKKPKTKLEIVNKIVKLAFGNGFSANYILFSNNSREYVIKSDRLENIVKRKWPYIPKLNENYEIAGKFISEDGSEIKVGAEYLNNAERYASLYKLYFNKEVSIKIRA